MACDFCRGIDTVRHRSADMSVSLQFDTLTFEATFTDEFGDEWVVILPIHATFCPICGQDLREVMNADT